MKLIILNNILADFLENTNIISSTSPHNWPAQEGYIDDLVQDYSICIANALEIL